MYETLPPLERSILEMLALLWTPVASTPLAACLARAGIRQPNGKVFDKQTLEPHLKRLIHHNLVTRADNRAGCVEGLRGELAEALVGSERLSLLAKAIEVQFPFPAYGLQERGDGVRRVRLALYGGDHGRAQAIEKSYRQKFAGDGGPYALIVRDFFPTRLLEQLPVEVALRLLGDHLLASLADLAPAEASFTALMEILRSPGASTAQGVREILLGMHAYALARGELSLAASVAAAAGPLDGAAVAQMAGCEAFIQGDFAAAARLLADAATLKGRKPKFDCLPTLGLFFLVLSLIRLGRTERLQQALQFIAPCEKRERSGTGISPGLKQLVLREMGSVEKAKTWVYARPPPFDALLQAQLHAWLQMKNEVGRGELFAFAAARHAWAPADRGGYRWCALQAAALLEALAPQEEKWARLREQLADELKLPLLAHALPQKAPWERTLTALIALAPPPTESAAPAALPDQRIAWFIDPNPYIRLTVREQKRRKGGGWTEGRVLAPDRRLMVSADDRPWITPQDRFAIEALISFPYWSTHHPDGRVADALAALVGHPYLFDQESGAPLELLAGEPQLQVSESGTGATLTLLPERTGCARFVLQREAPGRLRLIWFNDAQQRIAALIGEGLTVPQAAKGRLLEALQAVAGVVTVHADLADAGSLPVIEAEVRLHLHLLPAPAGLRAELLVRPFGDAGPWYAPGSGGQNVMAELQGVRRAARRDLAAERARAAALLVQLPTLASLDEGTFSWQLEQPEHCLELLLELKSAGDAVVVAWPEGERLRVRGQVGPAQLRLDLRQQKEWLSAEGALVLDDAQVLPMQQLLALLDESPSRFVRLGEGQFIALTQQFRRQLEELRAIGEPHGGALRIPPLAAPLLRALTEEAGEVNGDHHWRDLLARMDKAAAYRPRLPRTLQAELRDYQRQGFEWLARLAEWGVGGCLADDMGLGKTLQVLALLLHRGRGGPALVVAPASVCFNWQDEAARFAPTLNVRQFGAGERRALVEGLGPRDLLVVSYGLLQQEGELLSGRRWHTIVLDEAQAIKNLATKRAQTAMALQGEMRLAVTGTPLENHLGELWTLFRFINPGLLGSLDKFNQRFAGPIEREQDPKARARLRRLVSPFILRRTKGEVLSELPPRTEIQLLVEPGPEEAALYEALRRRALAQLTQEPGPAPQHRFQILAQITRLRRAACHPRLALPESAVSGAKLAAFGEIVDELLENGHRALVFSQFVDHLSLLREYLDGRGLAYQYLDGATPQPQRRRAVEAFQGGEGELFLISLKAGGVGLNLTGADYVIHMDPWWNPAVEEQASDRAHRMGQQRPVTIYRLVLRGTIEEKILKLHQAKRDLADSLLEGGELGARVSAEELLALLREG